MAGLFVALEGIEGSGKTTIGRRLVVACAAEGRDAIATREPGGTVIGEAIREILLGQGPAFGAETEALLFAAARAELVREVIRPALARGDVVVCDRFTDSSLAYQWGGRGLPRAAIWAAQRLATGGLQPDVKVLLDLPVLTGLRRRSGDEGSLNRIDEESIEFHERVRRAYCALSAEDATRWRVVDASRDAEAVWADVWREIAPLVVGGESGRDHGRVVNGEGAP